MTINQAELAAAVSTVNELLYTGSREGQPSRVHTWGKARGIDVVALVETCQLQGVSALREAVEVAKAAGEPIDYTAMVTIAALGGALLGVEAERARRDRQEFAI